MGFLVANALLIVAAWRCARWATARPWLRLAVGLALFQLAAVLGALLLGLTGMLTPPMSMGWAAIVALGTLPMTSKPNEETAWGMEDVPGLALLVGTFALGFARTGLGGSLFANDDTTYHAALPAAWLTEGGLHTVSYTYQAYYPMAAELFTFWFMIGTGDLTHASLASLLGGMLLAAAALAVAERLGWHRGMVAAIFASLLISRRLLQVSESTTAPDLSTAALLLLVAALVLRTNSIQLVVAGCLAGLALSTKVTAVVPLGVFALWILWKRSGADLLRFLMPLALLGSPIYLHNLWLTGNPLFPAEILFFEGPLDRATQVATSLRPFLWTEPLALLETRLNWPLPLGILLLIGVFGGGIRGATAGQQERTLLAGVALLALVLLPFQPFSGTINRPDQPLNNVVRYLLPPMALGLSALGWSRPPRWAIAGSVALWAGVFVHAIPTIRPWEVGVVLTSAACSGALLLFRRAHHRMVIPTVLALLLLAVAARTHQKRLKTVRDVPLASRTMLWQEALFEAVNRLPPGSLLTQVAEVPVAYDQSLRAYGGLLQHRYLPLDLDGTPLRPLHERWRDEPNGWFWRWQTPTHRGFMDNLRKTEIDYLLISRCNASKRWPRLRRTLQQQPNQRVFKSRCGEIWEISRP